MTKVPVSEGDAAPGAFGLSQIDPDNPAEWDYFIKSGATPSEKQLELAQKIEALAETVREFPETETTREFLSELYDLFAATLVQGVNVDLQKFIDDMDAKEREFYRRVVAPEHKLRLVQPTLITFAAFALFLIASFSFPWFDGKLTGVDLSWGDTIAMAVAGTLFGRLLYFAAAYGAPITSLEQFVQIKALSGTIVLSVFFDIIVGVAACLAFLSELLILAIGASGDAPDAGISSLTIATSHLSAFVFGMLVGFAKREFLKKLSNVTSKALE